MHWIVFASTICLIISFVLLHIKRRTTERWFARQNQLIEKNRCYLFSGEPSERKLRCAEKNLNRLIDLAERKSNIICVRF